MTFHPLPVKDAYLIELKQHSDHRGFFARAFCRDEYEQHKLNPHIAQMNISYSKEKYTLRGFHYQIGEAAEAKSVRCIKGKILDVIIDLRKASPTYCKHYSIELDAAQKQMLYVPEGFAHAFLTLEPDCEVLYAVSHPYTPELERGIRWNDPFFGISWPTDKPILSEKDQNWTAIDRD